MSKPSLLEKYGPDAWKELKQAWTAELRDGTTRADAPASQTHVGTNYMIQANAAAMKEFKEKIMRKTYMLELLDRDGAWTKIFQDESKTQLTNTALRLHQILGVRVHARIRDYVTGTVYAEMIYHI